jgi:hypothetical protein
LRQEKRGVEWIESRHQAHALFDDAQEEALLTLVKEQKKTNIMKGEGMDEEEGGWGERKKNPKS